MAPLIPPSSSPKPPQTLEEQQEEFLKLVNGYTERIKEVREGVKGILERIKSDNMETTKGLSFLEVKNHTLLDYITSLSHLTSLKLRGSSIQSTPTLSALLEDRVVLEKIKHIETKLKYRIDKLIKNVNSASSSLTDGGSTGGVGLAKGADPLMFKPNPSNLVIGGVEDKDQEDEEGEDEKTGIYRPPKVAPVHYDEGDKVEKLKMKSLVRASRSRLIKDLSHEFSELPEQQPTDGGTSMSSKLEKIDHHFKEKTDFEESNFIRVNYTKQEKKMAKLRRQVRVGMNDEVSNLLSDFGRGSWEGVDDVVAENQSRGGGITGLKRKRVFDGMERDGNGEGAGSEMGKKKGKFGGLISSEKAGDDGMTQYLKDKKKMNKKMAKLKAKKGK
ncbi:hypothetical protein BKA69DRAFT_1124647 [Paraphysoderma sedebokerense]|nr:hypothetical protein BKA69DRAFT_1124647 [Paraphysoderma sedebokerense]